MLLRFLCFICLALLGGQAYVCVVGYIGAEWVVRPELEGKVILPPPTPSPTYSWRRYYYSPTPPPPTFRPTSYFNRFNPTPPPTTPKNDYFPACGPIRQYRNGNGQDPQLYERGFNSMPSKEWKASAVLLGIVVALRLGIVVFSMMFTLIQAPFVYNLDDFLDNDTSFHIYGIYSICGILGCCDDESCGAQEGPRHTVLAAFAGISFWITLLFSVPGLCCIAAGFGELKGSNNDAPSCNMCDDDTDKFKLVGCEMGLSFYFMIADAGCTLLMLLITRWMHSIMEGTSMLAGSGSIFAKRSARNAARARAKAEKARQEKLEKERKQAEKKRIEEERQRKEEEAIHFAKWNPFVIKTLGGDEYEVTDWGAAENLKHHAVKQHPELGDPNTFDLLTEADKRVDPHKQSKWRDRMMDGSFPKLEFILFYKDVASGSIKKKKSVRTEAELDADITAMASGNPVITNPVFAETEDWRA